VTNIYFRGGLNDGVAQALDVSGRHEIQCVYDHFNGPSDIYRPTAETVLMDGVEYAVVEYERAGR
jgi:hypothetical protein